MFYKINFIANIILLLGYSICGFGQISQGGEPYSANIKAYLKNPDKWESIQEVPVIRMPAVDNEQLARENAYENEVDVFVFATRFDCDIDIKDMGLKDSLNIGILYRCAIESPTAYSLSVIFDRFKIPDGAKIFMYDSDNKQLLGAFTSNNNKPNNIFAIAPIFAPKIIVEYFEPYYANFSGEVHIGQVYHGFIDISEQINSIYDGVCEVDINCSEGANWQTEKHSVCRIIFGGSGCSGALINNTSFDGIPYFLTANHCISTAETAAICVFYFNYEHSTCGGGSINSSQTLSGATLRAHSDNTDFSLLELLEVPNATFSPFWAGWDRHSEHGAGGVGIHHPYGFPKKISTYDMIPKTTSCVYPANNYYLIDEWKETTNGYGITERGSSGSPLFNDKHRIIGQLRGACSGHNDNCDNPANDYSVYGKFHLSWNSGTNANSRLKDWLDPTNKGYMAIEGLNTCSDDAILDMNIYQAVSTSGVTALYSREYIESSAKLLSGAQVSYVANDYIKLLPGFKVNQSAEFYARISHTMCNVSSPISILNWNNGITEDATLEFNVVNAKQYEIQVHSFSGEKILNITDTIENNSIIVRLPQHMTDSSYLVTSSFYNDIERISNTYILNNVADSKIVKQSVEYKNIVSDVNTLDMTIIPNPIIDMMKLHIYADNFTPFSLIIYDLNGNVIVSCHYINAMTLQLNVSELPTGEYIAQVNMGNRQISKRFFKKTN